MVNFEAICDKNGIVMHDLINVTINGKIAPHEWYFLRMLSREEIMSNKELADAFVAYVFQYFPEYRWHFFKQEDHLSTVVCECEFKAFQFAKKYQYCLPFDKMEENYLTEAMAFGDIVTDFLIRYRNYSLIKCSGQKIILTARSDCHKIFEEYLAKGFSLQRLAKVGYNKKTRMVNKDDIDYQREGVFYKLPVLPTRDIGYEIDEIIETNSGEYRKVVNLSKSLK